MRNASPFSMRNSTVIAIIFVLGVALIVSLYWRKDRNPEVLKYHIADLSKRHLELSRQVPSPVYIPPVYTPGTHVPRDYGYNNFPTPYGSSIPYQRGLDGPLKFYAPVEQRYNDRWQKVGVVMSVSPSDDTIYNLEQRAVFPFTEDNFEYRVYDTYKHIHINVPRQSGRKLYNGDKFIVPGRENIGLFEVARDTDYFMVPM
jgi:hypothetical protein